MQIEESFDIPVAPAVLWPWISRADHLSQWITDVRSFEVRPAGELEAGSRLIAHLARGAPIEAQVERAERNSALVLRAGGLPHGLDVLVTFVVREHQGMSALTLRAETRLTGVLVFAETMIASKARAKLKSLAESLRTAIGSSPGSILDA